MAQLEESVRRDKEIWRTPWQFKVKYSTEKDLAAVERALCSMASNVMAVNNGRDAEVTKQSDREVSLRNELFNTSRALSTAQVELHKLRKLLKEKYEVFVRRQVSRSKRTLYWELRNKFEEEEGEKIRAEVLARLEADKEEIRLALEDDILQMSSED
jgi:ribulose bisphosphate carboxylase small subunit